MILNNTLTFGTSCALGSAQCNGTIGLTCSGTCNCTQTKVWNNVSQCVCPSGTFLNTSNLCGKIDLLIVHSRISRLETLHSLNESCTIVGNECNPTKDLFCNNSRCLCDFSQKYWNRNYETCRKKTLFLFHVVRYVSSPVTRLNYSQSCTYDDDCLPTLICPTVPGVCNCSQYLADYTCNCANTKYYDSNLVQCGKFERFSPFKLTYLPILVSQSSFVQRYLSLLGELHLFDAVVLQQRSLCLSSRHELDLQQWNVSLIDDLLLSHRRALDVSPVAFENHSLL